MLGLGAGVPQQTQVAHDLVEVGPDPDALVRLRRRSIDRHVETVETAGDARRRAALVEQSQVRVRGDADPFLRRVGNHVEEPGMHHRLPQPLQVQFPQSAPRVD
jgi:hypothetical protein